MQFVEMTEGVEFIKMAPHNHGSKGAGKPFEWVGLFDLKQGEYTWSFAKVNGAYADPGMKFLMIRAQKRDTELIAAYDEEATRMFQAADPAPAVHHDPLTTQMRALHFSQNEALTIFKIPITKDGHYLFFTEHTPFEFEGKAHFFKDAAGNDIEPIQSRPPRAGIIITITAWTPTPGSAPQTSKSWQVIFMRHYVVLMGETAVLQKEL